MGRQPNRPVFQPRRPGESPPAVGCKHLVRPVRPKPDVVRGMGGKGRLIFDNCVFIQVKLLSSRCRNDSAFPWRATGPQSSEAGRKGGKP
jgi:hypothetical protein